MVSHAHSPASNPMHAFALEHLEVFVFRAPAEPPVQTSFGTMRERPAVLLKVTDQDGAHGWGEIWCNFPVVGAEHRARMAAYYLHPLALGKTWSSPQQCQQALHDALAVLAIQCGEPGTIHQIIAGLDTAIWDLLARKAGQPLWRFLSGQQTEHANPVPVYASGLNPTNPEQLAAQKLQEGYRAFKLKVGFGAERDLANLQAMRAVIGTELPLMVDANQAWTAAQATMAAQTMAQFDLGWLEEPIRADRPVAEWQQLSQAQPLQLAAGENLSAMPDFIAYLDSDAIGVMQPDLGKWGGISGCFEVAQHTLARGKLFCPHWLGGGIGLMASMHLKAAVGGAGYVEVDANPNVLRELLAMPVFALKDGAVTLNQAPGLGVEPDLVATRDFVVQVTGI